MISKEIFLKGILKVDDKLLAAKVLDKAVKSEKIRGLVSSDFLDPYHRSIIEKALAGFKNINFIFYGGYDGAERVIINFCPDFISFDDVTYPLKVIDIKLNGRSDLSHRDYLGALMGLGIKRDKIGDILVKEDSCSVIVLEEIADFIGYNLDKVGNTGVTVNIKDTGEIEPPKQKTKEIYATVASLRLDSISSAAFGMSRGKMAELIKAERVSLNWETTANLTKQIKEGDIISIKGKGRVLLQEVGKTTKKGRISVTLTKYI